MAQTGFTPIITYHSTTGAAVPDAANLSPGELAVNIADMKLYAENDSGVVTLLASADAAAGNFTTVDTTNLEVTNIKAKDGTASIVLTDSTGDAAFSSTGAVKVPVGTLLQRPAVPVAGQLRFNDDSDEFEGYNGTAWASVGGSAISNDTSTASDLYPIYVDATTGTAANVYTSDPQYLFKPSTGELKVKAPVASNGILVNADEMTSNYTIDSGTNGLSVGPFTISGGVTLTIAAGQRHLIL